MSVRITFAELQDELFSQGIVDLFGDRNSEGDICDLCMMLQDGSEIIIKGAGNQPLVFEKEGS